MSEYKTRLSLERQLIKKINTWFPDVKLMGLSIDSLKRWISTNRVNTNSLGVSKLFEISSKLKSLANRSQEIVDPEILTELGKIKFEMNLLSKDQFEKITMPNIR